MNDNVALILKALLAILIGSGGVIAAFYGLNILVEKTLPEKVRTKVLPWIYVGPSLLLLGGYLVL
ncbi:MAG: sugar ABC transporter permease, partial [Cyanobacteria bacterium J06639_18]